MTLAYHDFLATKRWQAPSSGIECDPDEVSGHLFDFQRHIVAWAVRRGRAAVWADTGLGKTRMQCEWLRKVLGAFSRRGLILAPLGVTAQTVAEAKSIGIDIAYVHDQAEADAAPQRIVITNYERLGKMDPRVFDAVVLDESSILKSYSGVTKRALVEAFRDTQYRLACTATPAPNDIEELCNHADFLSVMSPAEMRSTFFIADSRGEFMRYRIKGHAEGAFYEWLASWAIACRTPEDLGFDGSRYVLPELVIRDHIVPTDWRPDGSLFSLGLGGVTERAQVRKGTLAQRVEKALELIRAEPNERWIAWCGRNDESDAIAAALPNAVNVQGSDDADDKSERLTAFAQGRIQVLVTKASVAGYGLNFQRCARMVFVGLGDSYEQYYQSIRRCYRFGQERPVHVHIVLADVEQEIADNVREKEVRAAAVSSGIIAAVASENRRELFAGTSKGDSFEPSRSMTVPSWLEES